MTMHQFGEVESDFTPLTKAFNDRRKDSPMPVLLELVKKIHDSQKDLDDRLTRHMTDETSELAMAVAKLMREAFPEGDPEGHRRHHELVIKRAEEQAAFWKEMRIAGGKWLGLGILTFIAGAAWTAFLNGPHK